MSYTYTYRSPRRYRHPITWSTTISEAANILSLGYMAAGKGWNEKDKKMFKNPFAQFLKLETDFVKYWRITQDGTLVGHVNAGIIFLLDAFSLFRDLSESLVRTSSLSDSR